MTLWKLLKLSLPWSVSLGLSPRYCQGGNKDCGLPGLRDMKTPYVKKKKVLIYSFFLWAATLTYELRLEKNRGCNTSQRDFRRPSFRRSWKFSLQILLKLLSEAPLVRLYRCRTALTQQRDDLEDVFLQINYVSLMFHKCETAARSLLAARGNNWVTERKKVFHVVVDAKEIQFPSETFKNIQEDPSPSWTLKRTTLPPGHSGGPLWFLDTQ